MTQQNAVLIYFAAEACEFCWKMFSYRNSNDAFFCSILLLCLCDPSICRGEGGEGICNYCRPVINFSEE